MRSFSRNLGSGSSGATIENLLAYQDVHSSRAFFFFFFFLFCDMVLYSPKMVVLGLVKCNVG